MLATFIDKHQLPKKFSATVEKYYLPIAVKIFDEYSKNKIPYFVGINGCQGSGKSTFTEFIGEYLKSTYQLNVAVISLDDFYLPSEQRKNLARDVHPLLATRGVPGTHKTELLKQTLTNLHLKKIGYSIPKFDKSLDEPFPEKLWITVTEPVDIILFEGWCWGVSSQTTAELQIPINTLELKYDDHGKWRSYVNKQLEEHYQPLYQLMNYWVVLQAPSFNCVHQWRLEQEQKLAQKTQNLSHSAVMNSAQILTFIQHFQRLTEHGIATLFKSANVTLFLDSTRSITHTNKDKTLLKQTLIFSDLDGTLLDHYTYESTAAEATIKRLKNAGIPIILNTSKTQAELISIQERLDLNTPFIIENGAAVFIPKSTFTHQPPDTDVVGDYWVKSFSSPREYWLTLLEKHMSDYKTLYRGFSTLTVPELSDITGLTIEDANLAKQRQYGEPVQWLGDDESKQKFINRLKNLGANVLLGGRFFHVSGHCDKGQALIWLTNLYKAEAQTLVKNTSFSTIALGDGENDIAMLAAADIAIQIRSPVHDFPAIPHHNNIIQTEAFGPEGWAQELQTLLFEQTTSSFKALT